MKKVLGLNFMVKCSLFYSVLIVLQYQALLPKMFLMFICSLFSDKSGLLSIPD